MLPVIAWAALPPATLSQFENVLAQDSATRALEQWCAARHIATPPVIHAHKLRTADHTVPRDVRRQLGVSNTAAVTLRHVRLSCGDTALSLAWNWYVPDRLTPAMNAALRDSDVPFGKVIASLDFKREALPTIAGPERNCPRGTISTHQARLTLRNGEPLAFVIECYTAANVQE